MPYDTPYNRKIAEENNMIIRNFMNHIEQNHMSPYLEYDTGFRGGYANRGEMDNNYEEVEMKGSGLKEDLNILKAIAKVEKPKAKKGRSKKMQVGMKDIKQVEVKEVKVDGIPIMEAIKASGKNKGKRGRPKKMQGGKQNLSSVVESEGQTFMSSQEKLDRIVKEGGKKPKPKKGGKKIEDIINAVEQKQEGSAELKKGGAMCGRTIGGRKLLLKEEQPPSQMSGNGKKEKKPNAWLLHLANFRKANPLLKGKEAVKKAKESYNK